MMKIVNYALVCTTTALGCGSSAPPVMAPAPSPPMAAAPAPAPPPEASSTTTGVYLDPTIASACGIEQPKAFFEFDSARLEAGAGLDSVATCFSSGPLKGKSMEIVGRADPRGGDEYNKQLGRSRAESVSAYLSSKGLGNEMMTVRSTGEEKAAGTDENGWAYDRRVDVRLAK